MSDYNTHDDEYENVVSINTEDLLTQSNTFNSTIISKNKVKEDNKEEVPISKVIEEESKNSGNILINSKKDDDYFHQNNSEKYGDDSKYESWADNNIFFPIANKLVDPFKDLGLTPNMVTYMSTFCTLLAIYYISINEFEFAALAYFIGYLLDCVDGKLARKHNMISKEGMVLDCVTDNITNIILTLFLVYKYGYYNWFIILIVIMSMLLTLSYGLNEAIASKKATGNDNFLERKEKQIGANSHILDNLFLYITGLAYSSYKRFFPTYDEDKINKWLPILKEFGPGNYCLVVTFIIFNLSNVKAIN